MKIDFFIYDKYNSIVDYMLADLKQVNEVQFHYVINSPCNSKMKSLYYVKKACEKWQWKMRKQKEIDCLTDICFMTNEAMLGFKREDLLKIKSKVNKLIALLIDPVDAGYITISYAKKMLDLFDEVITFDPNDAQKYGYVYSNTLYSKIDVSGLPAVSTDLLYIGHLKDRQNLLSDLIEKGQDNNAVLDIEVLGADPEKKKLKSAVILREKIPYEDVVNKVLTTKCVLDITQKNQSGITLRYYEAVAYNKKLLTNNDYIKELPFYDPRYMKIFHSVDEIDWNWIMNSDLPDYGYTEQFSPKNIMPILND